MVACRFWSHGFVALLGNNHLVQVSSYTEPRPQLLAFPPNENISSWTLIPPGDSLSRSVEVLLAIGKSLYVVDSTDAEDRGLDRGPFQHIAVSPNGRYVALYTEDEKVWVVTSDFQNRLLEYSSRVQTTPKDLQWCGNDAVALAWEDEVHLIGFNGSVAEYLYDSWVHLISDIDGIKLFTNDVCEFLERVPDVTMDVFHLSSKSPASVLLDAVNQLDQKSPKADDDIQLIKHQLDEAVDICVRAAGQEYDKYWQKQLLKAASFGKSVLDLYNSDDFVEMTETLRVLNSVRFFEIGLPLSYEQYSRLNPERLIQRLMNRNEYLLALKLSEFLRLPTDKIYVHWACQKVRVSSEPEEAICRTIVSRLKGKRGISFEAIATCAQEEGRSNLATELLNYEPRAGKQVPLLLRMDEQTIALDKAIESGDTDLIYHVILAIKKKLPLASFFRVINTRPVATALIEAVAWDTDRALLKDLYYQDDRRIEGADLLFAEALDLHDTTRISDKLRLASKLVADSKDSFTGKTLEETARLLKMQEALDKDVDLKFTGRSLNDTLFQLIKGGALKRATRIANDFRVPDKQFWRVKLRALVSRRDWTELEELVKSGKKSPIGWEPFFNEVLAAGNLKLAAAFVSKCTAVTAKQRIDMYVKCNAVGKAAEEAGKAKDMQALLELRSKVSAERDATEVERWISILQRK